MYNWFKPSPSDKFVSDTHFGHENILNFERTQFSTIEEHDQFIKKLITKEAKTCNVLYHLGDFGELSEENIKFWHNLPCHTVLIRGNHDSQKGKLLQAFDFVSDTPIFYNKRILLSHEPLPVTNETLNLHGHLHNAKLHNKNYVNLSIDVANYKLMTGKKVMQLLAEQPKIAQSFMSEWYAKDYDFLGPQPDVRFENTGEINLVETRLHRLLNTTDNRRYTSALSKFKAKYPDFHDADKHVLDFLIYEYPNKANFTPDDIANFNKPKL